MDGNAKETVHPAPDVDDRPRAGPYHCLALDAYSCHLCLGRCVGLGGPYAVVDADHWHSAASLGFVAEDKNSGMARGVHILVRMGLGDRNLEEQEGVQEGKKPRSSVGKPAGVVRGRKGQGN